MSWSIRIAKRTAKDIGRLPEEVQLRLVALIKRMEIYGPYIETWSPEERQKYKNYGALYGVGKRYHCHLKKGRPTYVACWEVHLKTIVVEFYYVGTHEKAPY